MGKPNITKFNTGAIRDDQTGKTDFTETISWIAFGRFADYMTSKKSRYGRGNFKKGIPIESYEQSLLRHIHKYMANKEGANLEPNEDHLAAAVFNIFGIMHEQWRDKVKPMTNEQRLNVLKELMSIDTSEAVDRKALMEFAESVLPKQAKKWWEFWKK